MAENTTKLIESLLRLFTIKQTARELNCSTRSVWRLLGEDQLSGVRIGRTVRVTRESIDAFIAKGEGAVSQISGQHTGAAPPALSLEDSVRDGHARGWSYTPLNGKDPFHMGWQKAPRPPLEEVLGWVKAGHNVGVRTGAASGELIALDNDTAKYGVVVLLELPQTVTVITGGGARHHYFRNTSGKRIGNSAGNLPPHVDVRGEGGQVVAAGSVHPITGAVYEYAPGLAPWEVEVAELPAWVLEALSGPKPRKAKPKKAASFTVPTVTADRYVLAAVAGELERVRTAENGTRNDTLNRSAFSLGQFVGAGRLNRAEVERELLAATALPEDEAMPTIKSGLDAGQQQPREPEKPKSTDRLSPQAEVLDPSRLTTDLGNAGRFARRHGEIARYVYGAGRWYVWAGTHWRYDQNGEVPRLCHDTARSIYDEAKAASATIDAQKELCKWALQSQHRDRLSAIETLARSHCALSAERLDADPFALNCTNGTVDLRDGTLRPHRREEYLTFICPTPFDPSATCPRWDRFLVEVLPNPRVRAYVQRLLGYGITGDVREQILPIAYGVGNNGKSVLMDTIAAVVGSDYATEAPPELLANRKGGSEHPTQIADLKGRRLVFASESDEDARLKTQLVKRLTGNARLKGRFMHKDFMEFNRTHKIFLATNHLPIVGENTEAIWRRLRLIKFEVVVPEGQRDTKLLLTLGSESRGILAWLVRGAVDWFKHGLQEPGEVMAATAKYRAGSDEFGQFVAGAVKRCPDGVMVSGELRERYETLCRASGWKPLDGPAYADALRKEGFVPDKRKAHGASQRIWRGGELR